jgi:hypothetical protein
VDHKLYSGAPLAIAHIQPINLVRRPVPTEELGMNSRDMIVRLKKYELRLISVGET